MKKNFKYLLVFVLVMVIAFSAMLLVACKNNNNNDNPPVNTSDYVDYTITVTRNSGQPFGGANVLLYPQDGSRPYFATANANGTAVISAPKADYTVKFTNIVEGYKADDNYVLLADETMKVFELGASLLPSGITKDTSYTIGSVMNDFSFTDVYGQEYTLSELFQTKKVVLLNFWYIGCYWCGYEFPAMASAYGQYAEDVAVIAFDTDPEDSKADIINYAGENSLPFIIVDAGESVSGALFNAFGYNANPASVVIDRQGVVCFEEMGAQDESKFLELFRRYTAEPYNPFIYFPDVSTKVLPDVDAPSVVDVANTINAEGVNATYSFINDEYNWPWVIEGDYIKTSNSGHHDSYSIINATIQGESTQCIAFDYKLLTEASNDLFLVYADNVLVHQYSGNVSEWTTCYAYVPVKDGEHSLAFAYSKDNSRNPEGDYVAIKNVRYVPVEAIDERTEIMYHAASGEIIGNSYSDYITPVYNSADGYYHVGSENGPLLLADIMNQDTAWSNTSAWSYVDTAKLIYDFDGDGIEEDYTDIFTLFAQIAHNSPRNGYLAVTEDIKTALMVLTAKYSNSHANEWLELCSYVIVYGSDGEVLGDPAVGLGYYNAFDAVVNENPEEQKLNTVVKDHIIMPRGIYFRFVPSETAVYKINSVGSYDTLCYIYDANLNLIIENDEDTDPNLPFGENLNFTVKALFEKDTTYYIALDFNDVTELGTFDFVINKLATSGNVWVHASAANYQTVLDENGNVVDVVIRNAVKYALDENGVYHVLNSDGTLGSKLYIDMVGYTYLFPFNTMESAADMTCYYCKTCGSKYYGSVEYFETQDMPFCAVCLTTGKVNFEKRNMFELPTPVRDENGNIRVVSFEQIDEDDNVTVLYVPLYELNTNENIDYSDPNAYLGDLATYGIKFEDYSETIAHYIELSKTEGNYPVENEVEGLISHFGFIEANEELVDILSKFIVFGDYSLSPSLENAWLMMACYYMYLA